MKRYIQASHDVMNMFKFMSFKNKLPWWFLIAAKIILSRLPVPYSFWKRLRVFEHGDMNKPVRALDSFIEHASTASLLVDKSNPCKLKQIDEGITVLELGPGDSIFTAVIAKSLGASRTWLVDAGAYATTDSDAQMELIDLLRSKGYAPPLSSSTDLDELLRVSNGKFLTGGTDSLCEISSASVDFCFSNAVLEHVPKVDFCRMVKEIKRVLKLDGVSVHRVDLKDHLGGRLNNLRFTEKVWESKLFSKSGFYTNRIRYSEMVDIFNDAGFECAVSNMGCWDKMPTPIRALSASFRELPASDILVREFDIVLRHKH